MTKERNVNFPFFAGIVEYWVFENPAYGMEHSNFSVTVSVRILRRVGEF
jgi:hypothetical protein